MEEELIKRISIIYKEFEKLYEEILSKNRINKESVKNLLDYTDIMKEHFKGDSRLFARVIYLFFDSEDSKIDILSELMCIYEDVKEKYYE